MRQQVWKFAITMEPQVEMPAGAVLLHVDVQDGRPFVWARVDPEAPTVKWWLPVYGTGHPLDADGLPYVGTFHLDSDLALVFHVFDAGEGS